MLLGLFILGCSDDPGVAGRGPRWPDPGVGVVVEVAARVDAAGRASAWTAEAWAAPDEPTARGCSVAEAHRAAGVAAVDVGAPGAVRLTPAGDGSLRAAGPLTAHDARWQVGDVGIVRADGRVSRFEGALRFGDAPDLGELELRDDGGAWVRWTPHPGESVEVEGVNAAGQRVRCVGDSGLLLVPWTAFDPRHPEVLVRAVRTRQVSDPNTSRVEVRAAVEAVLSLGAPTRWTERVLPGSPFLAPSPGPRRAWRGRARRG